jgi:DNA helicase IV
MRAAAVALHDSVIGQGKGGTHQAREERDVIVRASLARLEQLRLGEEPLCFGRLDRTTGERFYIGRLGVSDEDQEPLVVDWRAPVAEPFYRATGRHPMGLVRRRHFATAGSRIVGVEDEVFDLDAAAADEASLSGEGALLASLERARTGTMRDIVATIQAEQDEIIRAPLPGVLVVQGGPGTGKTAVALHRAAYLLYTHRFPLERQGVLVVGPNPLFLRYIEQVLPSLGETGVTLTTVSGVPRLGGGRPPGAASATAVDSALAARVKGDARMAKVVAKAVADRQRPLPRDATIAFGAFTLRLSVSDSAQAVQAARRRRGTHNARRPLVEDVVLGRLHDQLEAAATRARRAGLRAADGDGFDRDEFAEDVRHVPELRAALDRMWPLLTPEELLHDLFGAPALIELAAGRHLDAAERAALHRRRSATVADVAWTEADLPLLDEAAVLLGPKRRRNHDAEGVRTFGHIVVDEAQDLSPMQLRMVGRRSLSGSMTVVGDIGQATGTWAPAGWREVLTHLPRRRPPRIVELSVNYRTPAEIMEVAARVLAVTDPHLRPPRSVRSTGLPPAVCSTTPAELASVSVAAARELRADVGGAVAVICPTSLAPAIVGALGGGQLSLEAPIAVVPVGTVKGLEFDAVVVAEPAAVAEDTPQGLRALYVALTRATKRLVMVHARPLPAVLGLTSEPRLVS